MKKPTIILLFAFTLIVKSIYAQSYSDNLSPKSDSVIQFFAGIPKTSEVLDFVENYLENKELLNEINELEVDLEAAKGNDQLEMELNLILGYKCKWVSLRLETFEHFNRALFLAEKLEDQKNIATSSFEIGNHMRMGSINNEPYQPYYQRAIKIFDKLDYPIGKSHMLYAQAIMEADVGKQRILISDAISVLEKDIDESNLYMMESLARNYNAKGSYYEKNDPIEIYQKAFVIAKKSNLYLLQAHTLNNIGFELQLSKEYEKAIPYHLRAMDVSIFAGIKGLIVNSANNLTRCYQNIGMYKEVLEFNHTFSQILSSITNENYPDNLAEEKVTHEVARVELRNNLLTTEKISQNRQRIALIIFAFLLLLISGIIFQSRRKIGMANEKLQALDKVKARFFANISHELRAPITLINGPIEAVLKGEYGNITSTLSQVLGVVKNNGKGLSKLVNEILNLAKLEAGKLKLIENPVLFYAYLIELLDAFKSDIETRKINFQLNFQYDQDGSLLLDEAKFAKIINNLLSNAFKFSPDNGNIIMNVKEVNEHLTISVKDFGQGIHADDIGQIFDRFYQSEQPDTKVQGGRNRTGTVSRAG